MSDERLVAIIRHLMKGEPVDLQMQYFFCRPGTRGFSSHQNTYCVHAPQDQFVSAWLALEDVTLENGALAGLPGSQKEPVLDIREIPHPSTFGQDANHNRQECIVETDYPKHSVAVRQGAIVFLHSRVVHSLNHNTKTDRFCRVLLMMYMAERALFRLGYIAKRRTFSLNA